MNYFLFINLITVEPLIRNNRMDSCVVKRIGFCCLNFPAKRLIRLEIPMNIAITILLYTFEPLPQ